MGKYMAIDNFNKKVEWLIQYEKDHPERIIRNMEGLEGKLYHRKPERIPEIGTVSGKLTLVGYALGGYGGLKAVIVKCSCGRPEYPVDQNNFKKFKSTRCNLCALKSTSTKKKLFWGYSEIVPDDAHRVRLLNRIAAAIGRCGNPKDASYYNYGGRGINVHPDWVEDRGKFLKYLITLDGWDNPSLDMDRIDCDGGYEPNNLRFITRSENAMNKRKVPKLQELIKEQADYIAELESKLYDLENLLTNPD